MNFVARIASNFFTMGDEQAGEAAPQEGQPAPEPAQEGTPVA